MTNIHVYSLEELISAAYSSAQDYQGDLNVSYESFCSRVIVIIDKHLGEDLTQSRLQNFFEKFFLNDLYLSEACTQGSEAAWSRFFDLYKTFIQDLCIYCCPSTDRAEELADKVLTNLFFADRSGRSRIASYDGRVPLSSWLDVVVRHKAIDDAALKINQTEPIDLLNDIVDKTFTEHIHADFRAQVYGSAIKDSLHVATRALSDREQLLLLLKYEKELQSNEIAVLLNVSASTITRQLQAIHKKLRDLVVQTLASCHNLNTAAIEECFEEILENPVYSILSCD